MILSRLFSKSAQEIVPEPSSADTPNHIAVIMDGNGRWAKRQGLPRAAGHKKGAETLREMLGECQKLGVKYLTVYAFSSENWQRPEKEVSELMGLLKLYLGKELTTLINNEISLKVIGCRDSLPSDIVKSIEDAEAKTSAFDKFNLTVCLSYGARQEITNATKSLASKVASGEISVDEISEDSITNELYTADYPEPDLLIRTGGEHRLSNFLLWQLAYTELYFSDILWPDFSAEHLQQACANFAKRERRYGTCTE